MKEKFDEFDNANFFSRIDNTHILELFVGLDEKGRKAIELRSQFMPRNITGTAAIDVNQYRKAEYHTIRFSLMETSITSLFYKFCDDLVEQTRTLGEEEEGYQAIVGRYLQWKKLFVGPNKKYLSEPEIMGLMGELMYLKKNLILQLGVDEALKAWSGQELTHKDFSYGATWCEVKAISKNSPSVRVSSLEQLDSENDGILAVFFLERMSPAYNGISLNRFILEVSERLNQPQKEIFFAKVAMQGFEFNDYYDEYVYELSSFVKYHVDKEGIFPKLVKQNVNAAVIKATYEILLSEIKAFEIKE